MTELDGDGGRDSVDDRCSEPSEDGGVGFEVESDGAGVFDISNTTDTSNKRKLFEKI